MRRDIVDWLARWIGHDAAVILAPTWFTFIGLAGLVCGVLIVRAARRGGDHVPTVAAAWLAAYVAAVLGGILLPMLADTVGHLARGHGLRVRWAGMTSYCGFLAGLAAVYWVLRRGRVSIARFGDLVAAPLGIGVALARTGCLVAGCDYGQVTAVPWAMRFPAGSPAWSDHVRSGLLPRVRDASLPVHPTQIYEIVLGLALFAGGLWLARQPWARRSQGRVFLAVVIGYGIGRLIIEMLRGDAGRGFFGPLSNGQVFCAALLVVALAALLRTGRGRVMALAVGLVFWTLVTPVPARADEPARASEPAPASALPSPYQLDLLVGTAAPINRRPGQVPQLSGLALSGSLALSRELAVGLDLESLANSVATHGSIMLMGSLRVALGDVVSPKLGLEARAGFGTTSINFASPAFADVLAPSIRGGVAMEWELNDQWALLLRPFTIDIINSAALGGPIMTYQMHIGIGYRFKPRARPAAAPLQPAVPAAAPAGATTPVTPDQSEAAPAAPAEPDPASEKDPAAKPDSEPEEPDEP